jgi:hypothetical protein
MVREFKLCWLVKPILKFRSVGIRTVKDAKNEFDETMENVIQKFYKTSGKSLSYDMTIRSSIVEISSKGRFDNNEYFLKPPKIYFNYNEISSQGKILEKEALKDLICLGQLIDNKWFCASRVIKDLFKNATTSISKKPMISYQIPGPGTYSVIFKPRTVSLQSNQTKQESEENNNCGTLCRNQRSIIIGLFLGLPFFILGTWAAYQM